jgi:hypothetical protein
MGIFKKYLRQQPEWRRKQRRRKRTTSCWQLNKSLCQRLWSFVSTGQDNSLSVSFGLYRAHLLAVIGYSLIYISIDAGSCNHISKHSTQMKTNRRRIFLSVFIGFSPKQLTCTLVFCDVVFNMFLVWDEMFKRVTSRWTASADYFREVRGRIWNNLDSKFARKLCWSSTNQLKSYGCKNMAGIISSLIFIT